MPKGYKISSEKKAKIIEMSVQGFPPRVIHQKTGVNTKTIRNMRYRYFKERPELKEASIRRMIKRSQRQEVPKIIPKKHIRTINDLDDHDTDLVGKLFLAAKEIARSEGLAEDGYRVVMNCNEGAGQTVFHIHLHLLGGRALGWPPG